MIGIAEVLYVNGLILAMFALIYIMPRIENKYGSGPAAAAAILLTANYLLIAMMVGNYLFTGVKP